MKITLTTYEIVMAAICGMMRQVENIKKNRAPYYGAGCTNDWQLHVEGALGEYALAKYLNINWAGKGALRLNDVGEFDVRTRSKDHYELILHPTDPDDRIFWLLCGNNGTYSIKGWIYARDGKQKQYWKDPAKGRPAFFVPHAALNHPDNFAY